MQRLSRIARLLGVRRYMWIKYAIDLTLWTVAAVFAFYLRLETALSQHLASAAVYIVLSFFVKAGLIYAFDLHRQSWHKVGVRDLYVLLRMIGLATLILLAVGFIVSPHISIPRSIPPLDSITALILLGGVRLAARIAYEWDISYEVNGKARRVLMVGAGETGTTMVREMLRHPEAEMEPVGFLDDDPTTWGQRIMGVPILGSIEDLPRVVRQVKPDEVLLTMPSATGETVRRVVRLARETQLKFRIVPAVYEILSGKVSLTQIRDVNLEDLLRRDPVHLDMGRIASSLKGQVVLVTGAGGSIGSEIVRQVARFRPRQIILLGRGENSIYQIKREMQRDWPQVDCRSVIADIQHRDKLANVFACYKPSVVFHAAAHKHVPLMEENADEAILNNVSGTKNVVELALEHNVRQFVNLSTDKAVNPVSVMGASKRLAEHLVERAADRTRPGQVFVTVRFGNVLGSRGSVVPIFTEQIRDGGPVTVTDPTMARYFMTIPEATQLVLQASSLGENGAIYVLDMGAPLKILDLAHDLIELSGFRPGVDIDIAITGIRAGEKLTEELIAADEEQQDSGQDKILMARRNGKIPADRFDSLLADLLAAASAQNEREIRRLLTELIPTYRSADLPRAKLA